MEVEHFAHKNKYPDKVLEWGNLLPACKRCNGAKHEHDTISEPIVDPFIDEPKDHFSLNLYRFRRKTAVGDKTIEVLDLNNPLRAVPKRFAIGEEVQKQVESAEARLASYQTHPTAPKRNKTLTAVTGLLMECQRSAPYSATAASVLHDSPQYVSLRVNMIGAKLWDSSLEDLHQASASLAL
jgi:hypothetical protein